jgi:hypothetical protein
MRLLPTRERILPKERPPVPVWVALRHFLWGYALPSTLLPLCLVLMQLADCVASTWTALTRSMRFLPYPESQ